MENIERLKNVTRFEVINQYGRQTVLYNIGDVELHLQDNGKTLKVLSRQHLITEQRK